MRINCFVEHLDVFSRIFKVAEYEYYSIFFSLVNTYIPPKLY